MKNYFIGLKLLFVMTILFGCVYPLLVTGLAQTLWPFQANGSIVTVNEKKVGSLLLEQSFSSPQYFWGRPSAGSFATVPSGASNAGVTNKSLIDQVKSRRQEFAQAHAITEDKVPVEMIFASGSGLDPDISLASAIVQMDRVAKARGFDESKQKRLKMLIEKSVQQPQLGFLGNERINVLNLNIQLDLL